MKIKKASAGGKNKILYIVCAVMIGIFALSTCVFFMVTTVPQHYQPLQPENSNEVSKYLTNYLAPEIHNKSQLDEPFEIVITQQGLDDIVARSLWPIKINNLTVSGPAVVLSEGQITLMAMVKYGRLGSVLTITMNPKVGADGLVSMNLSKAKAGVFDITTFAKQLSRKIIATYLGESEDNKLADDISAALVENRPFDPVFEAYDKLVRLTGIDISNGQVNLRFVPQADQ
ncbi:MAG: hypothetical protein ACYTFK_04460 [Planctomycetota bacterium]|jgi:hypothetical protein